MIFKHACTANKEDIFNVTGVFESGHTVLLGAVKRCMHALVIVCNGGSSPLVTLSAR